MEQSTSAANNDSPTEDETVVSGGLDEKEHFNVVFFGTSFIESPYFDYFVGGRTGNSFRF